VLQYERFVYSVYMTDIMLNIKVIFYLFIFVKSLFLIHCCLCRYYRQYYIVIIIDIIISSSSIMQINIIIIITFFLRLQL
jgi:hypothetical protein